MSFFWEIINVEFSNEDSVIQISMNYNIYSVIMTVYKTTTFDKHHSSNPSFEIQYTIKYTIDEDEFCMEGNWQDFDIWCKMFELPPFTNYILQSNIRIFKITVHKSKIQVFHRENDIHILIGNINTMTDEMRKIIITPYNTVDNIYIHANVSPATNTPITTLTPNTPITTLTPNTPSNTPPHTPIVDYIL
jgi:hypothetical protein